MDPILAQQPGPRPQQSDIADGFAISLILILFFVLAGVAMMARCFRRRGKRSADEKALDQLLERTPPEKPTSSRTARLPSQTLQAEPWERDDHWWKQKQEGED